MEVVDQYRLFDEATTSRPAVGDLLKHLAEQRKQGRPIAESYERILDSLHGRQAADLRASNWTASDRVYDADYLYPAEYRVEAWLTEPSLGTCRWRVGGEQVAEAPCRDTVSLPLAAGPIGEGWGGRGEVEVIRAEAARERTFRTAAMRQDRLSVP